MATQLAKIQIGTHKAKKFWLARRSDGHRFEGSAIYANNEKDAERVFARLGYHFANLLIVGAR